MYKLLSFGQNSAEFTIDVDERENYGRFLKQLPEGVKMEFSDNAGGLQVREGRLLMRIVYPEQIDIFDLQSSMNTLYRRH